jgi:DNA-binding NtrC family response regulator
VNAKLKMKVLLLIDSESGLLENLTEILELAGYDPEVIDSGDVKNGDLPSLDGKFIVLDAALNKKSQLVYNQLRHLNGNTPYPVLVLSSDGLPDQLYPKACAFLAMPFSAEEFLFQVKTCAEKCVENGVLV